MLDSKQMPGERWSCETTTRSAPLMMNVPWGAMRGSSPMYTRSSLTFLSSRRRNDVEGGGKSLALALALERAELGLADFVITELELDLFVVAFDGENFRENGLEAFVLALAEGNVLLEEIGVGIELDFNQVGRLDGFGQAAKVDPLTGGTSLPDGI